MGGVSSSDDDQIVHYSSGPDTGCEIGLQPGRAIVLSLRFNLLSRHTVHGIRQRDRMQIRKAASNVLDIPRPPWLGVAPRGGARRGAFLLVCFAALLLGPLSGGVVAQSNSPAGAIAGHVLDSAGKRVAGATVLLTGVATERDTSDSSGAFHFSNVAPGRYELTANTTSAGSASGVAWVAFSVASGSSATGLIVFIDFMVRTGSGRIAWSRRACAARPCNGSSC